MAKSEPDVKQVLSKYKRTFEREMANLTSDADPEVRAIAAEVVAHLGGAVSAPVLRQAPQDPQRNLKIPVAEQPVSVGASRHLHVALNDSFGRQHLQIPFEKPGEHRGPDLEAWVRVCAALEAARKRDQTAHEHSRLAA
jgi:hypothetical protein